MSIYRWFFLACLLLPVTNCQPQQEIPAEKPPSAYRIWPSQPPADCPFPISNDLTGIAFTGRHKEYEAADTWYPSWASDGNMYSPYADGSVGGIKSWAIGPKATTGQAKISGDDPMNLTVTTLGVYAASPEPYGGRYPSSSLVYDGIWYYGTYVLDDLHGICGNWCTLGPFVGFRISKDYGKTWSETTLTPAHNLFRETAKNGAKVKMGSPHFVDLGKNLEHSPDGKAYLVAHGATRPEAHNSWVSGDQIYLARVKPGTENVNDLSKYEFFSGHDERGQPKWTRNFPDIKPLIEWNEHAGCVTITYDMPLKKYLMCVTHGWPTVGIFDTYILESAQLTGPWKLVSYMKKFGEQGYFVNFPSKFISADGRTAWLCYAHNFTKDQRTNPPGGRYAMSLQEVKLLSGSTQGIPSMLAPPTK